MLVPNRNYQSPEYRYGFQGQEKDDEIKGNGNSLNFTFRMHDPRIGRFLSVDPLYDEFSWNSPYAFAENKLGLGKELEGKELEYNDKGMLVYRVQNGYGPTQMAASIEKDKEKFGYGATFRVEWTDVVRWNMEDFKAKGHYKNMEDIKELGYRHLNINKDDILKVNLSELNHIIPRKEVSYKNYSIPSFTAFTMGASASANGVSFGVSASGYAIKVPSGLPVWESGLTIKVSSIGYTPTASSTVAGAEISPIELGATHFYESYNKSLVESLKKPSQTTSGQIIGPLMVGGKYTNTFSDDYNTNLGAISFGSPGVSVSVSTPKSASKVIVDGLRSRADSIMRAREWLIQFPNDSVPKTYLEKVNTSNLTPDMFKN